MKMSVRLRALYIWLRYAGDWPNAVFAARLREAFDVRKTVDKKIER